MYVCTLALIFYNVWLLQTPQSVGTEEIKVQRNTLQKSILKSDLPLKRMALHHEWEP